MRIWHLLRMAYACLVLVAVGLFATAAAAQSCSGNGDAMNALGYDSLYTKTYFQSAVPYPAGTEFLIDLSWGDDLVHVDSYFMAAGTIHPIRTEDRAFRYSDVLPVAASDVVLHLSMEPAPGFASFMIEENLVNCIRPDVSRGDIEVSISPAPLDDETAGVIDIAIVPRDGGAPVPRGTVHVSMGAWSEYRDLDGAGRLSVTLPVLPAGQHLFVARYIADDPYANAVASLNVAVAPANMVGRLQEQTGDFVAARLRLLADSVDLPGLGKRKRGTVGLRAGESMEHFSFSASLADAAAMRAAGDLAGGRDRDRFDAWIEGTFSLFEATGASGRFGHVAAGADYLFADTLLAGITVQVDRTEATHPGGTTSGTGFLAGPYLSVGLVDDVSLDLALLYGRSANAISHTVGGTTYAGDFGTERWLFDGALRGSWTSGEWVLRPELALMLATERSEAYTATDGLGGSWAVPSIAALYYRAGIGLDVEYAIDLGEDLLLIPGAGFRVGLAGDGDLDGAFGRISGSLALQSEAWRAGAEVRLTGDATGYRALAARATLAAGF